MFIVRHHSWIRSPNPHNHIRRRRRSWLPGHVAGLGRRRSNRRRGNRRRRGGRNLCAALERAPPGAVVARPEPAEGACVEPVADAGAGAVPASAGERAAADPRAGPDADAGLAGHRKNCCVLAIPRDAVDHAHQATAAAQ